MLKLRTYLFISFSFTFGNLYVQNLVPNPSFENYTSCPMANQIFKLSPWCGLGGGEDAYNVCFNTLVGPGAGGFGIPYTFFGFQYPRTGNGIGSIVLKATNRREYLQVQLTQTLTAGKTYCGSMYLNLYNDTKYATDKIGMYFSAVPFACNQALPIPQVIPPLNLVPQITNPPGNFITDTLNWTEVSGIFVATGGEQYLTIGNFYDDANTNTIVVNPTSAYFVTIILIDDVSLTEINPAAAIADATICPGDSIALTSASTADFADYNWQPATGLSCTACATPKAAPQSNTTYTLTKKQCNSTTTAKVSITVTPDCNPKTQWSIPNVFTPNEDNVNDSFMITLPVGSILKEFSVYNRWGLQVKTMDLHGQTVLLWDGRTTSGEPCTEGTYFYTLQYTDTKGEVQKLKGFISLFR